MELVYPIRLSREDKALFKQAARASGVSLAEFIRTAAREKAQPARKTAACLSYADDIVLSREAELDPKGYIKKRVAKEMHVIADTGLLVGRWSKTHGYREWAIEWWKKAALPMLTSAANLQEGGWLLENHEVLFRMVKDGDLQIALDYQKEASAIHSLLRKYAPRMDLADASIVRLSELYPRHAVLTVNQGDFRVYRRFGTDVIPCEFPQIK